MCSNCNLRIFNHRTFFGDLWVKMLRLKKGFFHSFCFTVVRRQAAEGEIRWRNSISKVPNGC